MKNLIILLCIFLLANPGRAQYANQERLMDQANQAYSSADYGLAISLYDSVLSSGLESAILYFNLGNACFKLGNMPEAILYYEKALKLDPTDEDIRFNLELANSRIIDKMDPLPELFLKTWFRSARDMLSSDQWASAVIAFFIMALASFAVFLVSNIVSIRKIAFWSFVVLLFVMLASLFFSYRGYREYGSQSSAIIFTPTVTVKSSPSDNSVDLFVIHEGTKVNITDHVEGWNEVRLANGNVGWIKTNTYRYI